MHVLIVSHDKKHSDSLRNSVYRKSTTGNPFSVSVVANYDGAVHEVRARKPRVIITLPSFYTDKTTPDPRAWILLLRTLMREGYQGTLGVLHVSPLPVTLSLSRKCVQFGSVRVTLLNPHCFRNFHHGTMNTVRSKQSTRCLENMILPEI